MATIWKLIKVYVSVSLAYFAFIFLQNPALLREPKKWMLIDLLFNGSYYHLWYMVGVIYSMVMIYLICKIKLTKALLPGSFLLCRWAFGNVVLWHRQQAPDYEYTV